MTGDTIFHYVLPAGAAALAPIAYVFARFVLLSWYNRQDRSQLELPLHRPTPHVTPGE